MSAFHDSFVIQTRDQTEAVDITTRVNHAVGASGIENGIALISVPHATAGVYVNENEEGLVSDIVRVVREMFFQRSDYRHNRIDNNAAAHVASAVLGATLPLPVAHGGLVLGTWQRVFLMELDGPRSRTVDVTVVGEA